MRNLIFLFFVLISGLVAPIYAANPSPVKEINQEQFQILVGQYTKGFDGFMMIGKKPVILDIYATWCGPCRRLSPILQELAEEYKGKVDVYKIDLDKNRALGDAFRVQSIPMVIFFPVNGKPQYIMGLYPKKELKEVVEYMFFKEKVDEK